MHIKSFILASVAALAFTAPSFAAGYVPLGPKIYTPQPDIVTPQPDLVTPQPDIVTPQAPTITETTVVDRPATHNSGNSPTYVNGNEPGFWNPVCKTFAYVNADCTTLVMNPGGGGWPAVTHVNTIVTANPDIVTPQPDLVTPQPPIVTPQPDTCKQLGLGGHGLGYYSC